MAAKKKKTEQQIRIEMSSLRLWKLEFERVEGTKPETPQDVSFSFEVEVSRLTLNTISMEIEVDASLPSAKIECAYRADFKLHIEDSEADDYDTHFKMIIAQTAPAAMYPYIREAISSTASKAGIHNLVLPIVNFRNFMRVSEVEVPKYESMTD